MTLLVDTAVLLVAGVGSRLRPLTDEVPKALVKVGAVSMLERAVNQLREHGVRRFVFATGYRQDAVKAAVLGLGIDARFCHNPRFEDTQNSISLLACRAELDGRGFYKLDGDVLFERAILERLDAKGSALDVAVDGVRSLDAEAMKVIVDSQCKILKFGKSVPLIDAKGESIGIERVSVNASKAVFGALAKLREQGIVDRYYEDAYSDLIEQGTVGAAAVEVGDLNWTEIDDHADLERATQLFTCQ
ncbi:MAG TPA: phosphocholine cytidylyltransferase family protein [Polyangiaceae bacterium]